MDLDRFLALPTTPDGRPVIKLMADPSMTDAGGTPMGFLSLVPAGANGRTFAVAKSADPTNPLDGPKGAHPLAPGEDQPIWRRLFGFLFGGGVQEVAKADGATDFDAAMTAERLRRARWESTDALWEVIGNILEVPEVTDKAGAVGVALQRFSAHVLGLVTASLAMKAEDRVTIGREIATPSTLTAKAGRVISAANLAKLTAARDALANAAAVLAELITIGEPATKSATLPEDPAMLTADQIEVLARKASTEAVAVAKGAGLADPAKLAQVGADAFAAVVAKVAPGGPAQPAMPQDTLAKQMAMSGGMGGGMSEPLGEITAALRQIPALVAKVDELAGKVTALEEVTTKSGELAAATAERVAKIAPVPAAPRGATDPETPRETAAKGADGKGTDWKGSPFDLNPRKPAPAGA